VVLLGRLPVSGDEQAVSGPRLPCCGLPGRVRSRALAAGEKKFSLLLQHNRRTPAAEKVLQLSSCCRVNFNKMVGTHLSASTTYLLHRSYEEVVM
jgi:hypothetical protein